MTNGTILLMELDPSRVEQTREPLARAGYRVEVAHDGVAGLAAFERVRPDLVLIEPMIPKKNGFEVCREIKRSAEGRDTPVVILTSFYQATDYEERARSEYGCDLYLEQPVDPQRLLEACRDVLGGAEDGPEKADPALRRPAASPPRRARRRIGGALAAAALLAALGLTAFLAGPSGDPVSRQPQPTPAPATAIFRAVPPPFDAAPLLSSDADDPRLWLLELSATQDAPEPVEAPAVESIPAGRHEAARLAEVLEEMIAVPTPPDDPAQSDGLAADLTGLAARMEDVAPLAADAATEAPSADSIPLELTVKSNVKDGWLSLLVDGREVFSRELTVEPKKVKQFFRKIVGGPVEAFEATIRVPVGEHELVARVVADGRSYGTTATFAASPGHTLRLKLVAGRRDVELELEQTPEASPAPTPSDSAEVVAASR